jgi:hypothetical protein
MTPRKLQHLIAGRWERAGVDPPVMYPYDRVHLVCRAMDRAGHTFWDDPRDLAAGLNLKTAPFRAKGCGVELAGEGVVAFQWCADRRERGLRILHGIAHAELLREKWEHTEADVWLVTLEFAAPMHECRDLDTEEVAREAHAPADLVRLWHPVARTLGQPRLVRAA